MPAPEAFGGTERRRKARLQGILGRTPRPMSSVVSWEHIPLEAPPSSGRRIVLFNRLSTRQFSEAGPGFSLGAEGPQRT
ncbi:MAG TPA: hypothetical protein VI455_09915, partial [Terriglobia bacterium]